MDSSAIVPAASVLLTRGAGAAEVFLVRRSARLRFFGGFWAFPGGKVSDSDLDVARRQIGHEPIALSLATRRIAAARELFEETGVLIARRADGSFPADTPELAEARRRFLANDIGFDQLLAQQALMVHESDFAVIGEVTTPAFVPLRFATTFFVAHLPPEQEAEIWPGELDEGFWSTPAAMLDAWTRGECLLSPPTIMTLLAIRDHPAMDAPRRLGPLLVALSAGQIHPIYFAPAVQLIPLQTVGLPPASHTNAYLVGSGPVYLIDPGCSDPEEQRRLFTVLDEEEQRGRRLNAIVLTHHHGDHIGAAVACASRYHVPVWAHAATADLLTDKFSISRRIADGERLDLGPCPDGSGAWYLEVMHTPGHALGHLAFYEPRYRLLFAGDMVSTVTSIVIVPPEGDLAAYLQSLRRLRQLDLRLLLPAHGNASAQPHALIDDALEHRARREQQLLDALAGGPRTVAELGPELYKGLPENLMRLAGWQILAGLRKLHREGRAMPEDSGEHSEWRLIP